jgi:hypothetical protein
VLQHCCNKALVLQREKARKPINKHTSQYAT